MQQDLAGLTILTFAANYHWTFCISIDSELVSDEVYHRFLIPTPTHALQDNAAVVANGVLTTVHIMPPGAVDALYPFSACVAVDPLKAGILCLDLVNDYLVYAHPVGAHPDSCNPDLTLFVDHSHAVNCVLLHSVQR